MMSEKEKKLDKLKNEVFRCNDCGLCSAAGKNMVFGFGKADSALVFVGESPGKEEVRQGKPFVGRTGKVLDGLLTQAGIKRDDIYIANAIKCRPPKGHPINSKEITACAKHLEAQLKIIEPQIICTLGAIAARALLKTGKKMVDLRGLEFEKENYIIMPTYHPSYVIYNPRIREEVVSDLKNVRALLP